MGNKSSIERHLPKSVIDTLIHKIMEGKSTQMELVLWLEKKGLKISKSAMNRYCMKQKLISNGFANLGISAEVYAIHKAQVDELGRLLTQKLLIDRKINEILQLILSPIHCTDQEEASSPTDAEDPEAHPEVAT